MMKNPFKKVEKETVHVLSPAPDVIVPEIKVVVPPREIRQIKRLMWRNARKP